MPFRPCSCLCLQLLEVWRPQRGCTQRAFAWRPCICRKLRVAASEFNTCEVGELRVATRFDHIMRHSQSQEDYFVGQRIWLKISECTHIWGGNFSLNWMSWSTSRRSPMTLPQWVIMHAYSDAIQILSISLWSWCFVAIACHCLEFSTVSLFKIVTCSSLSTTAEDEFRWKVMALVGLTLLGTFLWDRLCVLFFAPEIFKAMGPLGPWVR